jgi:predicted Na+-dependent transporter
VTGWVTVAQRWLLALMLACYLLAGVLPGPGERLRGLTLTASSDVNAAGALGHAVSHPDPDLLTLAFGASAVVCGLGFLFGRWMSRLARCDSPDAISLTFATGMNNSSAAAVLAASWFPDRPEVLLPILSYSLLQKAVAGTVGGRRGRRPRIGPGRLRQPAQAH